jgi:hypothetical protein
MRVSKHGQEIKATLTGGFFLWWGDFFAIMPTSCLSFPPQS